MRNGMNVGICGLAGLIALWLVSADAHTDDTGIVAGLVLIFAAIFSFVRPQHPWLWGLFWGLCIPAKGLILLALGRSGADSAQVAQSLLALIPGFMGAYGAALLRGAITGFNKPESA